MLVFFFFFFNDTATTEIYTLSLHDALPISSTRPSYIRATPAAETSWPREASILSAGPLRARPPTMGLTASLGAREEARSEEHTSELQSRQYLVCRLLLEKKKKKNHNHYIVA